jgi:hypothetical protein
MWGGMSYVVRTAPATDCRNGLETFDTSIRRGVDVLWGLGLSDRELQRAALPVKLGGSGLRGAARTADAAYAASRAGTHQFAMPSEPSTSGISKTRQS